MSEKLSELSANPVVKCSHYIIYNMIMLIFYGDKQIYAKNNQTILEKKTKIIVHFNEK